MDSSDDKRDRVLKAALDCRTELVAYARSLLGNYAAADDVLQEAMLVVVKKYAQFHGKWLPATEQRAAAQKAIPLVPRENPSVTLYLLGIPVSRSDGPPVVVRPDSQFVVRGRLNKPAKVHFGIAVSYVNGEFAGKFRGDLDGQQPISEPDEDGQFEVVYRIGDFTLDPCVRDRKEELAVRPDDLVLNGVWAFTSPGGPSGLEVSEVELIPPEREEKR